MDLSESTWKLRFILYVHLVLIVNALLSHWIAPAYMFYNLIFMMSLVWAVGSKTSTEAVETALAIDFAAIFFDLAIIGFFVSGLYGWVFAIVNVIFRIVSLGVLHSEIQHRGPSIDM